jgi:hypothetical protein
MNFAEISEVLPALTQRIDFPKLILFYELIRHLKQRIALNQSLHITGPPAGLPISVHNFLCAALQTDDETIKIYWAAVRESAWNAPMPSRRPSHLLWIFLQYGLAYEIGEPTSALVLVTAQDLSLRFS